MGQRDDLHRHRLRVRRRAHGAALARAGARRRCPRRGLLRAGAPAGASRRAGPGEADASADELPTSTTSSASGIVDTRLIAPDHDPRGERVAAALEVMSRFAIDPRWLVHLPPTMAPTATSARPGLLEHPAEAFDAFRARRRGPGRVRGEAHGLARRRRGLPRRRGRGAGASASTTPARGIVVHPHRPALLRRRGLEAALLDGCGPPSTAPGCGTSWPPTGSCSTASCCRGRPRRRTCCAASTRRSAPPAADRRRGAEVLAAAAAGAWPSRTLAARAGSACGRPSTASSTPTGATAGRSASVADSRWPRSSRAGRRGPGPRRPGPRLAHGVAARLAEADPDFRDPDAGSRRRPGRRRPARRRHGVVGRS